MTYMNQQFDPSVTWEEAKEIASMWGGPFAIKGVMNSADAESYRNWCISHCNF